MYSAGMGMCKYVFVYISLRMCTYAQFMCMVCTHSCISMPWCARVHVCVCPGLQLNVYMCGTCVVA